MRRSTCTMALLATLSFGAAANDGVELRTKALMSAGASAVSATNYVKPEAPVAYGRDPMTALVQMETRDGATPRVTCAASASTLCYDADDGRIVYRGAREYMPKMQGFSADSISVRHNAIVFKYTFQ